MLPLVLSFSLVGLLLFVRWSLRAGPERTAHVLRWSAVGAVVAILLTLLARGGAALALPLLSVLPLVLRRWRALWRRPPSPAGGSNGKRGSGSTVETRFFRMSLDHRTGEMGGVVLAGEYAGRILMDLDLPQLLDIWDMCRGDPQSVAVFEAYLDRAYSEQWRDELRRRQAPPPSGSFSMNRQEAYEVLGLDQGATEAEVKEAHRRLIQRVHPDRGGSGYLAARINRAKEVLLGE